MKLFTLLKNFKNDESGAVTVDWVVLTAALVGLGLLVIGVVSQGLGTAADSINASLESAQQVPLGGAGAGAGGGEGEGE
jgi:Flp pilus assembly pilin Flp